MKLGHAAAALAAVAGLAATVIPVVPASSAAGHDRSLLALTDYAVYVSPNGDGRHDKAAVRFTLTKSADVSVRVLDQDGPPLTRLVHLGRLGAGLHRWRWNGRIAGGGTMPDDPNRYSIKVRAVRGTTRDTEYAHLVVDRTADQGTLVTSRPTVYPKATLVSDHILVQYLREGWKVLDSTDDEMTPLQVRLAIRSSAGRVVWSETKTGVIMRDTTGGFGSYTFTFDWYARAADGEPLPPGSYDATVTATDVAGNRASFTRRLEVSDRQLRPEVWTSTMAAGSASRYYPQWDTSCNGCGEFCGPVASTRYSGGLSFPPCLAYAPYGWTTADFTASPPVVAAPVDRYRITATGGPTTPGGNDTANSSAGTLGPGDDTMTGGWMGVGLTDEPYLPELTSPVTWGVLTRPPSSYDIASFTVEYRYYVPVETP